MSDHEKPVVFIHVMKCGGTSVRAGLSQGLTGRRSGPEIFEFDGHAAQNAVSHKNFADRVENARIFADALLPYVLLTMQPKLVIGHFRYRERYREFLDRAHFVTVLRDPVDRFVSLYLYRRYRQGVEIRVKTSLEELIESGKWSAYGHDYVDLFAGRDDLEPRSDEAIAAAVETLRRFSLVGFTAQLGDFAARVSERVDREVTIGRINASPVPDGDRRGQTDPATLDALKELCEPNRRVYEAVRLITK